MKLVNTRSPDSYLPVLKIAFASSDRHSVNQHFGSAQAFVVYEIYPQGFHLCEMVEFSGHALQQDGQEDKLEHKLDVLKGCVAVYCNAVGASAIRQLLALGIQPLKVDEGSQIEALLQDLQNEWQHQPPVWLQRALRQHRRRILGETLERKLLEEDWSEEV